MPKFFEGGTLQDDLDYAKRLDDVKKNIRKQLSLNPMSSEPSIRKEKFSSHPRCCSETDSTVSNSPRKSVDSNIGLDLEKLRKTAPTKSRKKRNKWTKEVRPSSVPCHIEVDIGDSSPRNSYEFEELKQLLYNNLEHKSSNVQPQKIPFKVMSDLNFEKKFKSFAEKSLQSMNDIKILMDKGVEPPDGDEDLDRRTLRVKEFSNRFSRNYLYPLVRQIDELSKWRSIHPGSNQKLFSAYQVIFNALQAYQNHLPTSIGACSSDKLKMLMKHLIDVCEIHQKLLPESDDYEYKELLDTFKESAEMTLKNIDNIFTYNYSGKVTSVKLNQNRFESKQKKSKNSLEERLYMYNASRFKKTSLWRKAAEALARDKNKNIKSRYRTAGFKHRPPVSRAKTEIFQIPESQLKLCTKKSLSNCRKPSPCNPCNDDNITTMIQMEDKDECQEKCDKDKEPASNEDIVVKLLQMVLDINANKKEENNKKTKDIEKIMDVMDKMKKGADYNSLKDVLKGLKFGNDCRETLELKIIESSESISEICLKQKKKKTPTVKVSGAKNAKLICIQDDNFVEDVKVEEETSRRSPSKCLQLLPKDYAVNIIQYKLDFSKNCKKNPLYMRTEQILPWVMMADLSDEILNTILLRVARELEINDIVEKVIH